MDDDDAASSVDGEPDRKSESLPGDIDKGPGKRTRRTFEEIAAKRVQDLEKLQQMNVDGWSAKRKENHLRAIDELASKIEQDTAKHNKQARKNRFINATSCPNEERSVKATDLCKSSDGLRVRKMYQCCSVEMGDGGRNL